MPTLDELINPPDDTGSTIQDLMGEPAGFRQPRSGVGEVLTGLRSGVTEEVPLQAGQVMQWLGEPTGGGFRQGIYDVGKDIADAAKARLELPENKLQPEAHGAVVNALAEGGKMLAPSIAAPAIVGGGLMLAGAAAPELAVGGAVGLGISSLLGAVPAAMQQGQQTLESVKESGASDEVARAAGWKNAFIEGVGEAAGTFVGGKFVGVAGKALGKAVAPTVAGTIKAATDTAVWKPFAKNLVGTAAAEVGTEIGQAGLQAAVEKEAGVDVDPLEQMKSVVGPTLGMTAFLAPFGLHANYRNAQSAKAVNTVIEDPASATPEQRQAVVDELHKQAVANGVPDADQWLVGAKEDVTAGLPIRRVANVIREEVTPAEQATAAIQGELLNNATSDRVKVDKVEGKKASISIGDQAAELLIEDAVKAVAAGNLEEVLTKKVVEQTPQEVPHEAAGALEAETVSPAFEELEPMKLAQALGKPNEINTLTTLGVTDPVQQSEMIVRDAVTQKVDLALMARAKGKTALADTLETQARENGTKLVEAGGEDIAPSVDAALSRLESAAQASTSSGVSSPRAATSPAEITQVGRQVSPDMIYNGEMEGLHLFTTQTGAAKGGTFAIQGTPTVEKVQQAHNTLQEKFAGTQSFAALDNLAATAVKRTITTGDLFTTIEQSPNVNIQKLGGFLKAFTPGSKLDAIVKVDPTAKASKYTPGTNEIVIKNLQNAPTSLHELVHSVTVRELKVRPDMQKRVKEVMALVKVQVAKSGLISKDTISGIEAAGGSKTFKNKFLAGELSGMEQIGYGLLNEQEFLAQAFSSPQFQGVLKATQIKTGGKLRSAWDALVEKVMQVLGIEAKHTTAFSEALSIAAQLASTDVTGTPLQAQTTKGGSTFIAQVQKDLKVFLGRGYDNLVKRGKLEVVENASELGTEGEALRTSNGKTAGAYFPLQKKVVLFADNLRPGGAADLMRHEAGHALLKEDKVFRKGRTKILKDFAVLAKTNPAVKAAFAKVPKDTERGFRGEEALMYFLQEKSNRQHNIFKRVLSAVKAALYRLGVAYGRFSESDLVSLFSQGTQAWARREQDQAPSRSLNEILAKLDQPEQLFSVVSDKMKEGQATIDQVLDAVQNSKDILRDTYVKYAKQWLAVTPRSHLAQTLGNKIHWLKDIDTHNKKMEAIKAQLPDDFYAIYQDAERIAEKNSGLKAFNNLLLVGTFNQMTPWLSENEQGWVSTTGPAALQTDSAERLWQAEGMRKSTGKSFVEAYLEVRTAWDRLKPVEQEQAKKVVDYLAFLRERERNNLLAVIEASSEGDQTLREQLMTQFNATFSKLRGIYVPLSRYGEYILKFTTQDGREQTEFFSSPGERRVFRNQMEAQGVDPDTFVEDVKRETQRGEAVIPQALREQLGKALEAKYMAGVDLSDDGAVSEAQQRAADAFSDLNQVIIRWMPETSALKNSIHRKNVLGAHTDMLRSSMDYVLRHAGSIAWMEYGRKIEADIQGFEEETKGMVADRDEKVRSGEGVINTDMRTELVNDARRWYQAVKNERVSPIASTLGKFSTAYYMTSPSTFLVQLTQLPVLTLPALARKFASLPKATAALTEGLRKAFSVKYSKDAMYGDADVNQLYADLHLKVTEKNRVGDRQLGEDFFSPAEKLQKVKGLKSDYKRELLALRESLARGDLDISAVHEASDIAQGKQTTAVGKALRYAMLPMQHGELGSRKATVLASYKLATEKKKDFFSALDDSSEIVGGTLYNYAKSDKGWFMQGDTVRTLTTFQTYRIKTALRMGILLMQATKGETPEVRREAMKEFLGVTAMSAALAGVHGTIIGGLVFGLANLFGGDDDEPFDAELEFDNWINERAGDLFGGVISYGLPTAAGMNISKRVGMGDLYGASSEPPEYLHGAQLAAWYAGNLIGPSFSVAQSWVKGYDQMFNKGNFMRGLEEALPKPLKDGLKAMRVASDGLKTGAGKKLLADEAIGPDEILMIGLGFNPDEVAKAQGAERSLNKIGTQLSERKGRLIRDAAQAIVESEDTDGPMAAIATFNKKLPRFAITGGDIRPAIKKMVLGEQGTTGLRQQQIAEQFGIQTYRGE